MQKHVLYPAFVALAFGCQSEGNPLTSPFPSGFLWGTATAGFQNDMGCPSSSCLDTASDWYQWVTSKVILDEGFVNADPLEAGNGQWELFASDYDLAKDGLGNNSVRLSIEWSRLFPTSTEGVSDYDGLRKLAHAEAVEHYHAVFAALKQRGLTPLVTLNHYTLPLWIHDGVACHADPETCTARGWLDGDRIVAEIAKYAGFAAKEYGAEVDLWATLNEPYAVVLAGYAKPGKPKDRSNPPGLSDLKFNYAATAIMSMLEGHARMYDAIRAADQVDADQDGKAAQVGLVPNLAAIQPQDADDEEDVAAVPNAHYLYNRLFLDALVRGEWDEDMDGKPDTIRDDLKGRMDFVGINYYQNLLVDGVGAPIAKRIPILTFLPNMKDSGFYPRGIYEMAMFVAKDYGLPIYITENGGSGDPKDLVPHLAWLRKAIAEGADVRGYFFWTLVDNYEWNSGYAYNLGMYKYDQQTKERTAKDVASVYRDIAQKNALTQLQLDSYGAVHSPK